MLGGLVTRPVSAGAALAQPLRQATPQRAAGLAGQRDRPATPADAVLIICAEDSQFGNPVEACPHENSLSPFGYTDVTFKTIFIPMRVFELKTGRVVTDAGVEIRGASCPEWLEYWSPTGIDTGQPSETYVAPADGDINADFNGLTNP